MGAQASERGWSGSRFSLWCGGQCRGDGGQLIQSTFQGLRIADTAVPASSLFCSFQQRSHVSNLCALEEEDGVSGDTGKPWESEVGNC